MPTLLEDLEFLYGYALEYESRDDDSRATQARNAIKAFIEANSPWLPPQQEGFGPWIEWRPGDLGPRVSDRVLILTDLMRSGQQNSARTSGVAATYNWGCDRDPSPIVAYCVKLPDADGKAVERKNALENGCGND